MLHADKAENMLHCEKREEFRELLMLIMESLQLGLMQAKWDLLKIRESFYSHLRTVQVGRQYLGGNTGCRNQGDQEKMPVTSLKDSNNLLLG